MSSNMLNIGVSGLVAYQQALNTISHNISNVNTEGYSRQRVELSATEPNRIANHYYGTGVLVTDVARMYDNFLATQVRASQSTNSDLEAYYKYASKIDEMLGNTDSGLDPALQGFFDSMQSLANDPSSTPVREVLLSDSQLLVERFHTLDQGLQTGLDGAHKDMQSSVTEINRLASTIADLNQSIVNSPGRHSEQMPNDLLDQRDQAINALSKYLNVSTLTTAEGFVNVYIGKGQPLVLDTNLSQLSVVDSDEIPNHKEITYSGFGTNGSSIITSQLVGGELGGLLRVRDEVLESGQDRLGLLAVGLSFDINEQHQQGLSLSNKTGLNFFADLSASKSSASTKNNPATDYQFNLQITDPSKLAPSDYQLTYDGTNYNLIRNSDGKTQTLSPVTPPSNSWDLSSDFGFTLTLDPASTTVNPGDKFYFNPLTQAASKFQMSLQDIQDIAAASPIETRSDINQNSLLPNSGNGALGLPRIREVSVLPVSLAPTSPATELSLTFMKDLSSLVPPPTSGPISGAGFVFAGGPTTPNTITVAYNPQVDGAKGRVLTLDLGNFKLDITATGNPDDGDRFVLENGSTARVSDNRNALRLAELQSWQGMLNGTANFQDTFSNYTANVSAKTHQANVNLEAQKGMLDFNKNALENKKGVNLDEEAANLIRFQQAYQAAAQVISTSSKLFDTLLSVVQ